MSPLAEPASLLIHDGELADVCAVMAGVGVEFLERRGSATPEDEATRWDLVISTPKRLLEFDPGPSGRQPVRIAVLDKDSKTLRAMLHRAGIDLIVRRPVHPAALRLLILHSLYRGPEKRRALRVSVGARVRVRVGLRRRPALLAELSLSGCRLFLQQKIDPPRRVVLQIPKDVAGSSGFSVRGQVVRCGASEQAGASVVALSFDRPEGRLAARLRSVVAAHTAGPAVMSRSVQSVSPAPPAPQPPAPAQDAPAPPERRETARHRYSDRVIALGVDAARVLLGRDISLGGMRVEPHPDVSVGDELRIALHVRAREEPLVVQARVSRNDGARGLVLQFHDLAEDAEAYLRRMVNFLPILAVREEEQGSGIVVSEILDHQPPLGSASA